MKCPKCEYVAAELREDGWFEGDKGDFYTLPIEMVRKRAWDDDREKMYACPNCGNVFIDV